MTKKTLAIILSALVVLMPFLGFPTTIKTIFYVVSGLLLIVLIELISIHSRKRSRTVIEDIATPPTGADGENKRGKDQNINDDVI